MESAVTGILIAEDIELIRQSVENGSWVDGTIGVAGASLDGLALAVDPVGTLLQCGVAWIIEHVRPLSEVLDRLAGDPGQIAASARSWRDVAGTLRLQAEDIGWSVRHDLSEWDGIGAQAYRVWSEQQQAAVRALAGAASSMAAVTEGTGMLVATVRILVRDAIAMLVSRLVVYAAEAAATLGLATPIVVAQVTAAISSCAATVVRWLKSLLHSLRNLVPIIRRLGDSVAEARGILSRTHGDTIGLNRVRRRGAGATQYFRMSTVRDVAAKYGIDLSGLNISLGNPKHRGFCGQTRPDGSIILLSPGFRSEEDLARTLIHEKFHHDELAAERPFPRNDAEFAAFEDRAYAYEEHWWNNQPIRPEPRAR